MELGEPEMKKAKTIAELRDEMYIDRRKKNNEAAKRSRDSRRQKEEQIADRLSYLEEENVKLQAQINILKGENDKLHMLLYRS